MLPTFVIGLREGLEAALIVGIIAAFLRKQGRRDLIRSLFVGVGIALALCVLVGVGLELYSRDLPQRGQEGLETVIGVLAVAMVTYMVVWMRRHSRELKGQLEGMATAAIHGASGAGKAMVAMAFLAVLREGFETAVFLLAAFNESTSGAGAAVGAVLGIVVAVGLGYGIYRGGVHINLSKFFRATGLVLVLVAAGLVVNALHTAHEAGWLNAGQGSTVDLSWLVTPGSVQASLLTGMLGIQSHPVVVEVIGWLVYLIPVGIYVAWPPGRAVPTRATARALLGTGAALALATLVLAVVAPGQPVQRPTTTSRAISARLVSLGGGAAVVRTPEQTPASSATPVGATRDIAINRTGVATRSGVSIEVYTTDRSRAASTAAAGLPSTLSYARVAALNGGRLPIGMTRSASGTATMDYRVTNLLSVWVEPRTGRIVDLSWHERITGAVTQPGRASLPLTSPVRDRTAELTESSYVDAARAARSDVSDLDHRSLYVGLAWTSGVLAVLLLLAGTAFAALGRSRRGAAELAPRRDTKLVSS